MSEKMQVPVKRFLYFLYAYIKILVKVGVSLISSLFTCKEKKHVLYMNYNLLDNNINTKM